MSLRSLRLRRKTKGRKWILQKGVRLCYPELLALGSRSEVRQRKGTAWFRIPLNSFRPLGQLQGNVSTVLHLLVIEGKGEALREFPLQKHTARRAVVKVNTASPADPVLLINADAPPTYGELMLEQTGGVTKNCAGGNHKNNLWQRCVYVCEFLLSSIFSLA